MQFGAFDHFKTPVRTVASAPASPSISSIGLNGKPPAAESFADQPGCVN
jgi:hypothetical protein